MFGTLVNCGAIIVGTLCGILLKKGFPENIKSIIMQGFSITVILIGLSMAIKSQNLLIVTLSIVIGGILGETLKIEERLNEMGAMLETRFGGGEGNLFTQAFVTASLVYCVGAMAIMGAIEAGLTGNYNTLFIKSILDGVSSVVFASNLGVGVAFAAVPVFIYQGIITIGASFVRAFLTDMIINEMTATGGLLILGIGINMLGTGVKIKVGNLLPGIFVSIALTAVFANFGL